MPNLTKRSQLPEIMDRPDVPEQELYKNLKELEVINKWLGGFSVTLNALEKLIWNGHTVRIMDIGCGGGDTLRAINRWAQKTGKSVELIGVDMNPFMTDYAVSQSKDLTNIRFLTMNVFDDRLMQEKPDIVINSLFCHHFDSQSLVQLLNRMRNLAGSAVIINDLCRHWLAYYLIKFLTAIFSTTYVVKHDAPLSVARALNRVEWENILWSAKIREYRLKFKWAWRWQIVITKPVANAS